MEMIKTLENLTISRLYDAFKEAFSDYERTWTREEFDEMLQRRGYSGEHSFGAFDGKCLVAFTLNCIDDWNGMKTAYDAGTGTVKAYRGRGLASRIFDESIPILKGAGVKQYLLEVLQHNTAAVSIYKRLKFQVSRKFDYFSVPTKSLRQEITITYPVVPIDLTHKEEMERMWDFVPSWQNSFASVQRRPTEFILRGIFRDGQLVGYGIFAPASGDLTQLAVAKDYRRLGIGSAILNDMLQSNNCSSIKILNTEEGNESVRSFARHFGIPLAGQQYEMLRAL
jgi:ribosomal protein S18 acetylase RimI-like enzyme